MSRQTALKNIGWIILFAIVSINLFLLIKIKSNLLTEKPLKSIDIEKPTLFLIVDEFECASCVNRLVFLNDLYASISAEGRLDFKGMILSKSKRDSKNIAKAFIFPFTITDNFNILKRLNLNHTPVIVGLSVDHKIVYAELIPFETTLTEEYIRKGVLDRLYYSLEL